MRRPPLIFNISPGAPGARLDLETDVSRGFGSRVTLPQGDQVRGTPVAG